MFVRQKILKNLKDLSELQRFIDQCPYNAPHNYCKEVEELKSKWRSIKEEIKSKQNEQDFLIQIQIIKDRVVALDKEEEVK